MKKIVNFILLCSIAICSILGLSFNVNSNNGSANTILVNKDTIKEAAGSEWLDSVNEPQNYDYSFAVVGDTQSIVYAFPEKLDIVYDYIVNNLVSKKIAHVFTLGDMTEGDSKGEWEYVKKAVSKLDGKVRYSLVRGNHDGKEGYLANFGNSSAYREQYKASFLSSLNTVVEFSAGELDYLVVNLDYCPSDEILDWANSVVEAHPYHNVIVTTHNNLDRDGNRDDSVTNGNGGSAQWTKFLSKHSNIVLCLYGHWDDENLEVIKSTGENGNVVSEIVIDPQRTDQIYDGGVGLVAFLYFSNGGKNVELRYYSTIRNQYYKAENQLSFELNTISRNK